MTLTPWTLAALVLALTWSGLAPGMASGEDARGNPHELGEQPSTPDSSRLLGTGPFQCLGPPRWAAINPSGTLIAALSWQGWERDSGRQGPGLDIFSIPDGERQPITLPDDAEPIQNPGQMAWLDDHRLLLLGSGTVTYLSQQTADVPWAMSVEQQPLSLYQIIDITAHTRVTVGFRSGERALGFGLSDDRQSVDFLILRPDHPPLISLAPMSDGDEEVFGLRPLDISGACPSLHILGRLAQGQYPEGFAIRPDARLSAIVLETMTRTHRALDLDLIDMRTAGIIQRCPLPRGLKDPVAMSWAADDDHLDILNLTQQPSTWTIALRAAIWSEHPGWLLRPAHRLDASGAVTATIGLHAVTLADGRFLSLLPAQLRGMDYFDSTYLVSQLSCLGPFATDDRRDYCALALGGVLRVFDLRHVRALSPEPTTWFDARGVQFLDTGDLAVASIHGTTIIQGAHERQVPAQDSLRVFMALGSGIGVGEDRQGGIRAIALLTGLGHQLMAGTPPNPLIQSVELSPNGSSALLCGSDRRLWLVKTGAHQLAQEMPCKRFNRRSPVTTTWNQDESIGFFAENWRMANTAANSCTGAWEVATGTLLWRPTDANGAEVSAAYALIPDPSARRVLLQSFVYADNGLRQIHPFLVPMQATRFDQLTCGFLDGATGLWQCSVLDPGTQAGFTPDGLRLVGTRGIVDISGNRLVQAFDASMTYRHVWMSPAHTWVLMTPPRGDWLLHDCATCGICLRLRRPPSPLGDQSVAAVSWDRSEQHIAVSFMSSVALVTMPLLPESPAMPSAGATAAIALPPHFEQLQGWLPAAIQVAGWGDQGVALLATGTMTAHRLMALELCARTGVLAADRLLDAAGSLPPPLGYLAHDCAYRIHQLRAQEAKAKAQAVESATP